MVTRFTLSKNEFLSRDIQGFYSLDYMGYGVPNNPDFLIDFQNNEGLLTKAGVLAAAEALWSILEVGLPLIHAQLEHRPLMVCVMPRARREFHYDRRQRYFKGVIQRYLQQHPEFKDGSNAILRHSDTLPIPIELGDMAESVEVVKAQALRPGLALASCAIDSIVESKTILLIDDIYAHGINVAEDTIEALLQRGATKVYYYAIAKRH